MKTSTAELSPSTFEQVRDKLWAVWAILAAFGCYFCMYAFRKPFTAATYADSTLWGMNFKTILVTTQVMGYTISKFIGIGVVAAMPRHKRAFALVGLIVVAEVALVLFGLTPRPWNAGFLFLNGLPLGMVFGLVLGFLEGRRVTELLTAGLCASFVLADGVTKTVGAWLLLQGVPEDWMPCVAGGIFLLPFLGCVTLLSQIPPPSESDIAARTERPTMTRAERVSFLKRYGAGLAPLVLTYLAVTIVRSIRADFAPEIWTGLGGSTAPSRFTITEIYVALGVFAANGAAVLIHDNRRAFFTALTTCGFGIALLATAIVSYKASLLSSFDFMMLVGLGLYLPYVAMHTTVFERLLGMTPDRGNLGFLMTLADAVGYLGYVAVMLVRNFVATSSDALGLLTLACWVTIGLSTISLGLSWRYFARLKPRPVETLD